MRSETPRANWPTLQPEASKYYFPPLPIYRYPSRQTERITKFALKAVADCCKWHLITQEKDYWSRS